MPGSSSGGSGLLFFSDFRTATGTSADAVSDGGKWDFVSVQRGPTPNKEIVPSTGLDFPTANVFRVISTAEDGGWSELRVSDLPIPAVGERRFYRWYFRLTEPDDLTDQDTHPMQDGGAGGASNWNFNVKNTPFQGVPAGTWAFHFTVMGEANASNTAHYRWYLGTEAQPTPLNKNQTYRIEVQWHRISETHYNLHARIYDSANTLLYDDDDFNNWNASLNLGADTPALLINNLPGQSVFNCGVNGIGDPAPFPFTYGYQGGFCVRSDTWCGAYNGAY